MRQRARDWRGLVRSATEHRSDSGAPESPTVGGWEKMSPYDTLPLPPGDAPKGEATSIKIAKIADAEG